MSTMKPGEIAIPTRGIGSIIFWIAAVAVAFTQIFDFVFVIVPSWKPSIPEEISVQVDQVRLERNVSYGNYLNSFPGFRVPGTVQPTPAFPAGGSRTVNSIREAAFILQQEPLSDVPRAQWTPSTKPIWNPDPPDYSPDNPYNPPIPPGNDYENTPVPPSEQTPVPPTNVLVASEVPTETPVAVPSATPSPENPSTPLPATATILPPPDQTATPSALPTQTTAPVPTETPAILPTGIPSPTGQSTPLPATAAISPTPGQTATPPTRTDNPYRQLGNVLHFTLHTKGFKSGFVGWRWTLVKSDTAHSFTSVDDPRLNNQPGYPQLGFDVDEQNEFMVAKQWIPYPGTPGQYVVLINFYDKENVGRGSFLSPPFYLSP